MTVHYILGGKGDMSGNVYATMVGGAYDPETITWNEAQGVDGIHLDFGFSAVVSDNGSGKVRVTKDGAFTNSVIGVYTWFEGVQYVQGRYRVDDIDIADGNYIDLDLVYTVPDSVNCVVGGALSMPTNNFDILTEATDLALAGDKVKVRNIMLFSTSWGIWISGNDGTPSDHIIVEAVDINGDRDLTTKVAVNRRTPLNIDPVLRFMSGVKYWEFHGFDFNGGLLATKILISEGSETNNSFYSCIFRNPVTAQVVISFEGNYLYLYDCEIYGATGAGGDGIDITSNDAIFDSCYIHDNAERGISSTAADFYRFRVLDCRIINNKYGIFADILLVNMIVINCTIANNTLDGIYIFNGNDDWTVSHCNITGNGGYGVNTAGQGPRGPSFEYNNSFNNSSGAIDVGVWATVGNGNNVELDPQYDDNFFIRNVELIQGGVDKRPIGPIHRVWKPPLERGAA